MAGPAPADSISFSQAPTYLQAFQPSATMSANKIDEGYSEDTRSQGSSDTLMRMDAALGEAAMMDQDQQYPLPESVLCMNEAERSEFAYALLRSLRTSSIAAIVEKLNPLLHLDPVIYLPPEVTFNIFSYLDSATLLRCSTLSRSWRARVMDSPLWRLMFRLEGWNSNFSQVRAFEESEKARRAEIKERKTRPRATDDGDSEKPSPKRRAQPTLFGGGNKAEWSWGDQYGTVEADENPPNRSEDQMEDVSYHDAPNPVPPPTSPLVRRWTSTSDQMEDVSSNPSISGIASKPSTSGISSNPTTSGTLDPPIPPTLLLPYGSEPKVSWQYLYKQKRRLEDNWDKGRYTNFQLPHPDHPEERHTECVYTIQYSGKYLASGSRDHSVRIWNLDTQRLVHPPLLQHEKSVLCLQFDERPDQDILISAGSDCAVILWKFSTGQMIRKIENAHAESVLNLRFDDQYLVTCSKDKTIKVWNRKELMPTDDAYPSFTTKSKAQFPSYIINVQQQMENAHLHFQPLPPYSLLMTLEGHGAAVNAIQIHDGQIISASGDRQVKAWDVRTGTCLRTFPGHTKGIACVQFDGRRIVSGSSDETVRIFDRATGAEVACLHGHTSLVRTVQAQFGDLPGNEEELEAEARAVDRKFFEAQSRGQVSDVLTREQRRARNAGSRDPNSIFALNAKLPPGGGGSKWARIVSGSYDETIVIWKKGPDGAWKTSKVLHQGDAARAAGGTARRRTVAQPRVRGPAPQNMPAQAGPPSNFQALAQQAQAQAQAAQTIAAQAQALHAAQAMIAAQANPGIAPPTHAQAAGGQHPAPTGHGAVANAAAHHHHHGAHHHHHPQHPQHLVNPANHTGTNARVFKLQFDARRIICCSQDPTIVGWDFANNDKDLIMASQFFGESL